MITPPGIMEKINNAENILIISHRNPDADALGSAGALAFFISENIAGQTPHIFCVDPVPANLKFLNLELFFKPAISDIGFYDLIIIVDCSDFKQTGIPDLLTEHHGEIISIDHHITNQYYAKHNLVRPEASATSEIIYSLFVDYNISITKNISTCLLAGIMTDTTYFTNGGTTQYSIKTASELLRQRGDIKNILHNLWRGHSPESLKIWGKILSNLQFNPKYKIVTAIFTKEDNEHQEISEGLANFLTSIYEADIILVIKEQASGMLKCSLRTIKNAIDVGKMALALGGGGHRKAAGFSLQGSLIKQGEGWKII